jgi:hypothetical protein
LRGAPPGREQFEKYGEALHGWWEGHGVASFTEAGVAKADEVYSGRSSELWLFDKAAIECRWPRPRPVVGEKTGPNPTDQGKPGTKRSVIVEGDGGPLGALIDGPHVHDTRLLDATIEAIVGERPEPTPEEPQHLSLEKGYDNPTSRATVAKHQYTPRIGPIGEEKAVLHGRKKHKPRRWVVERTLGWLSKCREILVRYNKNWFNCLGLIQPACALLWYRRLHRLSNP